jgi:hypothetical protein
MIKPEELRIGNWVKWPNEKEPNEAEWAHGHWLGVFDKNYPFPDPIPLTEEWLIKLGFEKQQEEHVWYELQISSSLALIEGDKNGYMEVFLLDHDDSVRVRYVHQLQNLYFALTGEELKIVTG